MDGCRRWGASSSNDSGKGLDPQARADVLSAAPPDERARWWRRQVVETANSVDFYANLQDDVWWTQLRLRVAGHQLRYLCSYRKSAEGRPGY